jgi:ATP-binding cassette subfamily C (CFTR/MRP) protein 1
VYLHYFLPVVAVVLLGYTYFAMFYRASAREVKRLDSILRSLLYSHFGERYAKSVSSYSPFSFIPHSSLSGLSTIRAYNAIQRFEDANDGYVDLENRA